MSNVLRLYSTCEGLSAKSLQGVNSIDMVDVVITKYSIDIITAASCGNLSNIVELYFIDSSFDCIDSMKAFFTLFTDVKSLDLTGCTQDITQYLAHLQLNELSLDRCELSQVFLQNLDLSKLIKLSLVQNENLPFSELSKLLKSCSELIELNLSESDVSHDTSDGSGLYSLLKNLRKLVFLDISDCILSNRDCMCIISWCSKRGHRARTQSDVFEKAILGTRRS